MRTKKQQIIVLERIAYALETSNELKKAEIKANERFYLNIFAMLNDKANGIIHATKKKGDKKNG